MRSGHTERHRAVEARNANEVGRNLVELVPRRLRQRGLLGGLSHGAKARRKFARAKKMWFLAERRARLRYMET